MRSEKIKLTVIIPNYNSGKYLKDCLESVISQTYDIFEVIVADDASTDNSREIIKEYEEKYDFIRGIYNKENVGVARNRHNAILQARGNYITTLDSDDFFYDEAKIEKEIELLQYHRENRHKDILPFSNVARVTEDGKLVTKVSHPQIIDY
jgi:teichuronic acid biosynthesis glycosyltransferase TuaG